MHIPNATPLYTPDFDIALVDDAASMFNEGRKQSNLLSLVSGEYAKLEGVYLIEQKMYRMMTGLPLDCPDDEGTPLDDLRNGTDPLARHPLAGEDVEQVRREPAPGPREYEGRDRPNIPEHDVSRVNSRSGPRGVICLAGVYVREAVAFAAQAGICDERIKTGPGIFLCPPVISSMARSMPYAASPEDCFPGGSAGFEAFLQLTFWHELGHHLFPFFGVGFEGFAEAFANLTAYEVSGARPNGNGYRRWLHVKTSRLQPALYSGYRVLLANQRGLDKFDSPCYRIQAIEEWKKANRLPNSGCELQLRSSQDEPALRAYAWLMIEPAGSISGSLTKAPIKSPQTVQTNAIEGRLFKHAYERIRKDYGLNGTYSDAHVFVQVLLNALGQTPILNPLAAPYTNHEVFEAAVRALGSNMRKWSLFLANEPELQKILMGYDPAKVVAGRVSPVSLMPFLPGQTAQNDSYAIIAWAHLLVQVPDYYQTVIVPVARMFQQLNPSLLMPELLLCMVGFFGNDPFPFSGNQLLAGGLPQPVQQNKWYGQWNYTNAAGKAVSRNIVRKKWKFPGMRYALGSEFMRNLRWNGFKVDRHIKRLLSRWIPVADPVVQNQANRLATVFGAHPPADLKDYFYYSLLGMAISPSGAWYSHVDNLIWALGVYVEKKGQESSTVYVQ